MWFTEVDWAIKTAYLPSRLHTQRHVRLGQTWTKESMILRSCVYFDRILNSFLSAGGNVLSTHPLKWTFCVTDAPWKTPTFRPNGDQRWRHWCTKEDTHVPPQWRPEVTSLMHHGRHPRPVPMETRDDVTDTLWKTPTSRPNGDQRWRHKATLQNADKSQLTLRTV